MDTAQPPLQRTRPKRAWKIAPGEGAWQWEDCLAGNFIAIGWDETGDVSQMTRDEFESKLDTVAAENGWKRQGPRQVWTFAHEIQPGDEIVANQGTKYVLGIGRVTGRYRFEPGVRHGHRMPVEWFDTTRREVQEPSWVSTILPLNDNKLEELKSAPPAPTPATSVLPGIGRSRGVWALAILRTLAEHAQGVRISDITSRVHQQASGQMSPELMLQVRDKRVVGWAKHSLKHEGYITNRAGIWSLTDKGREYHEKTRDMTLEFTFSPPAASEPDDRPTEKVPVTGQAAYCTPVLYQLQQNKQQRLPDVCAAVLPMLKGKLLPGDTRCNRSGGEIWKTRIWDALVKMKAAGEVHQPETGLWQITPRGQARLEAEPLEGWRIENFQTDARAEVVIEADPELLDEAPLPQRRELTRPIPASLVPILTQYLRLDLRPTPSPQQTVPLARNVIFYGPPGTGKTYLAKELANQLCGDYSLVQFHPSYSYEDFVQGIRPNLRENKLLYELHRGKFATVCDSARDAPDRYHVLIIDEINRADPARVFGELLYALEYRGHEVSLPGDSALIVPENLIVIGTMNSVDRSVALVDYALRRRFRFFRIEPDPGVVSHLRGQSSHTAVSAMVALNQHLAEELGKDHTIGHSYLLSSSYETLDDTDRRRLWEFELGPLLEEYFFGQPERVTRARRVWESGLLAPAD